MKIVVRLLLLTLFVCVPFNSLAMDHSKMSNDDMDHSKMDHDMSKMDHDMSKMDHDSMNMGGKSIPLGEAIVDGVKGTATLLDVREAMAKHGMKTTHHLMISFTDVESGEAIVQGRSAAKVTGADGKESKALKMMKMSDAFGTDLTLDQQGAYQFKVGTKLMDKKKRTFSFTFEK